MPTIAVIGPGAIGGALASLLIEKSDNTVSICARTPFDTLTITARGKRSIHRPRVHLAAHEVKPVDWIVLATKTYQVAQAAEWFPSLTGENTAMAVVQNGVEHIANLSSRFDPNRIVPVIIDCPAERPSQGVIIRHGDVRICVPNTDLGKAFGKLFDDPSVTVDTTDDWTTAAWRKLALNCSGAICALVNQPANVAKDTRARRVMEALIRECIAVAEAEGAVLDESIIASIIEGQSAAPDGSMNSLHADFVARRPTEWDARNGVIARRGKVHGIPTPCNRMAADLLSLMESSYLTK